VANSSSIEWTEATWNPTTGCDRISPGCDHCYALTLAKRLKAMGAAKYQVDGDPRTSGPGFGVQMHDSAVEIPLHWTTPRVVFVDSMSDLLHARVSNEFIGRVFDVMASTPRHTYQLLTKRPIRLARLAAALPWPENVWVGVSVETNEQAWRIDMLRQIPAAVRFISAEPLLGRLDKVSLAGIDWLIAGGESGPSARPVDSAWVEDLQSRCSREAVAFFFKQWGGRTPKARGRSLHGRTYDEMPTPMPRRAAAV
jgi:protein gp37